MTNTPGEHGPLTIPWDSTTGSQLDLAWPAAWPRPNVFRPDLSGVLRDYHEALTAALDGPVEGPRLEERARPGMRVALVVDDPSRWTPVREALPLVLKRLHAAGVAKGDVSISVGVGRHIAVDEPSMRRRVGDAVVDQYVCHSPPVDDRSAYVELGTTSQGVPVRVFRPVAEADLRILIGSVLPHLQAGFGGGTKLIFPGTSHRSTLGALHRQGIGHGAADRPTSPVDNPMRRAISEAAAMLGPCHSISHLLGAPGQILRVLSGPPDPVQLMLSTEAQMRFAAPMLGPPADLVVAGNHPWPGDPLQSFKVLLQHRSACRKGGVLAGFFWTDPSELDRSFPLPALRLIASTGAPGGWFLRNGLAAADRVSTRLALASAFMIHWARELVVDREVLVYAPLLRQAVGARLGPVRLFDDVCSLWLAAGKHLGPDRIATLHARVFPQGGLTYAPVHRD